MGFLLRIEDVAFDDFIYDTQNLSTVRGAGFLLRGISSKVEDKLKRLHCAYTLIVQGFIAEARRTRGSWASSYIPSSLMARALVAVEAEGPPASTRRWTIL